MDYNTITEEVLDQILNNLAPPIHRCNKFNHEYPDGIGEQKLRKRGSNAIQRIVSPKANKVGRNDLCTCGSVLKYKNCCGK